MPKLIWNSNKTIEKREFYLKWWAGTVERRIDSEGFHFGSTLLTVFEDAPNASEYPNALKIVYFLKRTPSDFCRNCYLLLCNFWNEALTFCSAEASLFCSILHVFALNFARPYTLMVFKILLLTRSTLLWSQKSEFWNFIFPWLFLD